MEARGLTPSQWRSLSRADRVEMLAYQYHQDRQRAEWQRRQAESSE